MECLADSASLWTAILNFLYFLMVFASDSCMLIHLHTQSQLHVFLWENYKYCRYRSICYHIHIYVYNHAVECCHVFSVSLQAQKRPPYFRRVSWSDRFWMLVRCTGHLVKQKLPAWTKCINLRTRIQKVVIRLCYLVTNKVKPRNKSDSQVKQLSLITNLNVHLK